MKRIIVIGASSGLGRRVAEIYASRGWKVGAAARRVDRLASLHDEYPDLVTVAGIDVTAADASDRLMALIGLLGGVDVIFNAAGVGFLNPDLDQEKDEVTIATNCDGFARIADAAFRYFASTESVGQIAAISSVASTRGLAMGASYSASKRFQMEYLVALRQLAGIRRLPIAVTDIRPGFVRTDLLDSSRNYPMLMDPDSVARKIVKAIDRRRRVAVIDWRWNIVVGLWRLIPRWLWVRLPIKIAL